MEEQLTLIAAAELEVLGALGCGRRDAAAAQAWWTRALALGAPELSPADDGLELCARTLLDGPSDALPLDGGPDGYWQALATFAVIAAWDGVRAAGLRALDDVDAALRAAAVAPPESLVAASHYPAAGLPPALDVDVRVIPASAAATAARAWLDATPSLAGAERMTRFCRRYVGLAGLAAAVGRPAPDWFAVTPACVALPQPFEALAWPPTPLPDPAPHSDLVALVRDLTDDFPDAAAPSDPAALDARFADVEGLYVVPGWRLEWRFADGLVRARNARGDTARYGRLSRTWGARFDAALAATGFPAPPAPGEAEGAPTRAAATLTLRETSVKIPQPATIAWGTVTGLLDGVLATVAPGSVDAAPEPGWVLPL